MKKQRGYALLQVLVFLGVGALLITPALSLASTTLQGRQMYQDDIKSDFATQSAIEYGMWRLNWEPDFATNLPIGEESDPFTINVNGVDATTSVVADAPPGQMSGQELATPPGMDLFFKLEKQVVVTASYEIIAFDGFESHSASGGTGAWNGPWTLSGDYYFDTSGEYDGAYHLRLRGDSNSTPGDGYAQRAADLSSYSEPSLEFWARMSSFESSDNDNVEVRVSTNGTDWDVLETFDHNDDDNVYRMHRYDLTSYGSPANLYVSFKLTGDHSSDTFWADNVQFVNAGEAQAEPGILTEYTYYVNLQCMNPDGCTYDGWGWGHGNEDLQSITDELPRRGASSGDYLQYIPSSTDWDAEEWGIDPFEPSTSNTGWGSELRQRVFWDFDPHVDFEYGEIKTMNFRAWAALEEGVYCNTIYVDPDEQALRGGGQAKIIVGNPVDTRCSGGLLELEKTCDTPVIYPDEETTLTYTITIKNVDTIPITVYGIEDWLPSTAVEDPTFEYVTNSAHGQIDRPSFPVLFYDGFNRSDSNDVSYWIDSDSAGSDARIYNEHVRMGLGNSITQEDISTVDVSNIILTYNWQGYSFFANDGFESGDGNGGEGMWNGPWTLSGDYEFHTYGEHSGTYHLLLQGDANLNPGDGYAQRSVDVTGRSATTLKFWARIDGLEGSDKMDVLVSTNGTDWDVIRTFVNGEDDHTYHPYEFDLSSYLPASTLYLAFDVNTDSSSDYFYLDDIRFIDPVNPDTLKVEWKPSSEETWNLLAEHPLDTDSWQNPSHTLPASADDTTIDLRFTGVTDNLTSSEYAAVDNVKLYVKPISVAFDGFEDGAGGGTGSWNGSWTLSGDYSYNTSGEYEGDYHLRLRSSTGYAQRSVDLSGYTQPYFSYYAKLTSFESGETADVLVSTNGTDWDVLKTYIDGEDDGLYHQYQFDVSSYGSPSTFYIAFDANMSSNMDYFYIDNVEFIDMSNSLPYTPIGMPDENEGTDFFDISWNSTHLRTMLEWNFSDYPEEDDPVWDTGGLCGIYGEAGLDLRPTGGYWWDDYNPYLELQPGETLTLTFQSIVTLQASGAYYNEFFVWIDEDWWSQDGIYSWPTGGVTVPQFDLQAETITSLLRANSQLTYDGIRLRSWHWWWRR